MDVLYPLVLFTTVGGVAIGLCVRGVPEPERRWLGVWLTVTLALRLLVATMFAALPSTRIFHEDAEGYELWGMLMARGWHGDGPQTIIDINQNYGYKYIAAATYYVFGQFQPLLAFSNCVIGLLTVFLVYRLARQFFHPLVARRAMLLTALVPSMILWSSMALKDTLMSLLILIALSSCVSLKRRFSIWPILGVAASIAAMQPIRYYMIYFLGFAIVLSLFLDRGMSLVSGVYKQIALVGLVAAVLALVGLSGNVSEGTSTLNLAQASSFRHGMAITAQSGFAADADASTPAGALALMPLGIAELLLGPFPWQFGSLRALFAAPETIYWWLLFPSVIRGLFWSVRSRFAETSPLVLFAVIMTCAYSLLHGNVGSGFRQRSQIFVILFVFAAYGTYRRRAKNARIDTDLLLADELKPRAPAKAAAAS
jgi:4-amino-4-deoxy-L-arabinose transferase-like glycosyltransferase